jgi:type III pantothenate kinase
LNTLFVDAGNTRVKWQLGIAADIQSCAIDESLQFVDWVRQAAHKIESIAISSVQTNDWNQMLESLCHELVIEHWLAESQGESMGLISAYANSEHLGVDRWLAMLALWNKYGKGFVLVDAGTAITLDVVDNWGKHQGGFILPGLELQRAALLNTSQSLATLVTEPAEYQADLATDTRAAIDHGIFASTVALVEKLMSDAGHGQLVITGGDAAHFLVALPEGVGIENLVLRGLDMAWAEHHRNREIRDMTSQ